MNKLLKMAVATIAAFGLIIGTVHANKEDGEYRSCNTEKKLEKVTEKLGLNESQQQLFLEFAEAKKAAKENRKTNHEEKKAQFDALVEKETLEVSDITNMMDQKAEQRREAMQPVLEKFVAFRNSLTEEQRAESKNMIKHLLMGGRKHHRGKEHKS